MSYDQMAVGCVVIAAFVEATQQALTGAPTVAGVLPSFLASGLLNYVPLALITVAAFLWIIQARTPALRKSGVIEVLAGKGTTDAITPLTLVENQTIRRATVVLDGHHYKNCTFDQVTFRFDGGPFEWTNCASTNASIHSDNKMIKAYEKALALIGREHKGQWTFHV